MSNFVSGLLNRVFHRTPAAVPKPVEPEIIARMRSHVHDLTSLSLTHLRTGTRPSLIGTIEGLTPTLEQQFRSGQLIVERSFAPNQLAHAHFRRPGEAHNDPKTWQELGFSGNGIEEQKRALRIYNEWYRSEVLFGELDTNPAVETERNEMDRAIGSVFSKRFPKINFYPHIFTRPVRWLHLIELMEFVPKAAFKRGFITLIISDYENNIAPFPGSFSGRNFTQDRILTLFSNSHFDRHYSTAYLLMQLGMALFDVLDDPEKKKLEAIGNTALPYDFFCKGFVPIPMVPDVSFSMDFMFFSILDRKKYLRSPESPKYQTRSEMHKFLLSLFADGEIRPGDHRAKTD